MKQRIVVNNLNYGGKEEACVELAGICPFCNHALSPKVLFASLIEYDQETQNKVFILNYCSNCDNEFMSVHFFDYEDDGYEHTASAPAPFSKYPFSENIQKLSPQFITTYNDSLRAESLELNSICGMGYRKSLEFLVKDYAIFKNPDKKSDIEKSLLGKCIETYISDKRLQTLAKASAWLGNDQTHYVQKHSAHGLKELKQFIKAFVAFIDADLAYQDAVTFISGSSS